MSLLRGLSRSVAREVRHMRQMLNGVGPRLRLRSIFHQSSCCGSSVAYTRGGVRVPICLCCGHVPPQVI